MRLAFYAPLKPPTHPVPSGDRAMARALLAALEQMGAQTELASEMRSRDGKGDTAQQETLFAQAKAEIPKIVENGRAAGWQAWITYHCYYKAPDLIGPTVARALKIPYLLVEATRARKRLGGPWDAFARASEAACDAASVIFYLTARDQEALAAYAPPQQQLIHLRPFLARNDLPPTAKGKHLLAVGMMRAAAKLGSYGLIAETMKHLPQDTELEIAGDGPARAQVEAVMAPFANRTRFLGALNQAELSEAYTRASALIWPGVDEAFGVVYLEAQAHGLPVIAQDREGVRDVLFPRPYPAVASGGAGLAEFARLTPPAQEDIRSFIAARHLLPSAAKTLALGLERAGVT